MNSIIKLGGLAQSVECVVRNDEAPGSKPGFSTFCVTDLTATPLGSSVGRAGDCKCNTAAIPRSVVRVHPGRPFWITTVDDLAEWLRRWPAKPLGYAREGSNPSVVAIFAGPNKNNGASSGNRTRATCLEGRNSSH